MHGHCIGDQTNGLRRLTEHLCGCQAFHTHVSDRGCSLLLAQLHSYTVSDQWMVEVARWLGSAENPSQADLAPRGRQEILVADYDVHTVPEIVNGHGKLIGPLSNPVSQQKVAALVLRPLLLRAQKAV